MESRLVVKYYKEASLCDKGAVELQLFQAMGFFQEGDSVIITHASELNQSKQCDTYNHAVYTVEFFT